MSDLFDIKLQEVAQEEDVFFIDLFEDLLTQGYQKTLIDGIHANDQGHTMLFDKTYLSSQKMFFNAVRSKA